MDNFYRRRDVRDLCERVFDVLGVQLDDRAEFVRDFLTGVRDLMREGVKFEDAVLNFEDPQRLQQAPPVRTPNAGLSEQPEVAAYEPEEAASALNAWYDSNRRLIAHKFEMALPPSADFWVAPLGD